MAIITSHILYQTNNNEILQYSAYVHVVCYSINFSCILFLFILFRLLKRNVLFCSYPNTQQFPLFDCNKYNVTSFLSKSSMDFHVCGSIDNRVTSKSIEQVSLTIRIYTLPWSDWCDGIFGQLRFSFLQTIIALRFKSKHFYHYQKVLIQCHCYWMSCSLPNLCRRNWKSRI